MTVAPHAHLEHRFLSLDALLNELHCGLIVQDEDFTVLFLNDKLLMLTGYSREEVVGRQGSDLVAPEVRELAIRERQLVLAGDFRPRLVALQRKDSSTFPVLLLPHLIHDAAENFVGTFALVIDMGEINTAKPIGEEPGSVSTILRRIALELHTVSLTAGRAAHTVLQPDHPHLSELSQREREVLTLLVSGDRVANIAKGLHISQHTVRNHLKSIYRKVGVRGQAELIECVRGNSAAAL